MSVSRFRSEQEQRESFGWGSLAEAGVFTLVIAGAATMAFVIQGFDPALAVDLVLMLVGVALVNRERRSGAIVLLIGIVIFLIFGGYFALHVLSVPRSSVYFVLSAAYVVAGISTLIATVALLRAGKVPSRTARAIAIGASVLFVAVAGLSLSMRLLYDEPAEDSGISLLAEDNEFHPEDLSAPAGEAIVVDNEDLSLHTFSIEELDLSVDLPGGLRTSIAVGAEPGTYEYFCEIFGHDDMKGTLTIR